MLFRSYSEEVAAQVDEEVRNILDRATEECIRILEAHREVLDTVAEFLLEHETMSAEEFEAVFRPEDAVRILQFTGADAAMIGRGCFGNPWLFQQAQAALDGEEIPPLPPLRERAALAVRQIELAVADKGEHIAILEARKQYAWYLKGVPHANYYKEQIVRMNTLEDVYRVTKGIQRDLT